MWPLFKKLWVRKELLWRNVNLKFGQNTDSIVADQHFQHFRKCKHIVKVCLYLLCMIWTIGLEWISLGLGKTQRSWFWATLCFYNLNLHSSISLAKETPCQKMHRVVWKEYHNKTNKLREFCSIYYLFGRSSSQT